MNFLSVVAVWCLNGVVSRDETGMVQAAESNLQPQSTIAPECYLPPNLNGRYNGILYAERRIFYNATKQQCVMFVPKKTGNTTGNNFVRRKDCFEACIPESPCLKPRKGKFNGTIKGYTYYADSDYCAKAKYGKSAQFWPEYNRFHSSDECYNKCAPELPIKRKY
uniref:Putative tick kunitz 1 n=1 Tax=Amblyomma triste TaxID=251400 RepID=A0A023G9V7_AMBTT